MFAKKRVTPEDVAQAIRHTFYSTALDGLSNVALLSLDKEERKRLSHVTICTIYLRNNTVVVGVNHGAIDPEQYDSKLAAEMAHKQALDKVYELLGYELRTQVATTLARQRPDDEEKKDYCESDA